MLLSLALLALITSPQTPDPTLPPADAHVQNAVVGRGVQIYRCTAKFGGLTSGSFEWAFEAPDATLLDPSTHQPVGTHSAGPTWTWNDGSSITGTVLQTQPSSDPANIPWLLITTQSIGAAAGELADVTLVRRSDTQAGIAPKTGCDMGHLHSIVRVPYQATYTFYTTSK
jgi:Protein of unknown function (DUF3455)